MRHLTFYFGVPLLGVGGIPWTQIYVIWRQFSMILCQTKRVCQTTIINRCIIKKEVGFIPMFSWIQNSHHLIVQWMTQITPVPFGSILNFTGTGMSCARVQLMYKKVIGFSHKFSDLYLNGRGMAIHPGHREEAWVSILYREAEK